MKKLVMIALTLALSLGTLSACNGGNNANGNSNSNNPSQQSSRTAAETVLLYADLCNAKDYQSLRDILYDYDDFNLDSDGYTFVSMTINVQNPNAQMEPFEIDYYQNRVDGLLDTAIICAEVKYIYNNPDSHTDEEYVQYLDFYLISTEAHPNWMIATWANQAGY